MYLSVLPQEETLKFLEHVLGVNNWNFYRVVFPIWVPMCTVYLGLFIELRLPIRRLIVAA